MVSRSVTCPIGRNIGSTRAFQKCITWDGSPPGESPIRKMCIFARADRRELMHDARALFRMGFSTFGGGILKCLQILGGGAKYFFNNLSSTYSFGDLRHIQLSTNVWPCHSPVDIVPTRGRRRRRLTCDKLSRSSKW